jgi:putative transcriptional regulator
MPIKIHLSRLLGEQKMNVSELARRSGISRYALHFLYHEQTKKISFGLLEKLCKALEVSIGEILEYVPKDNENDKKALS